MTHENARTEFTSSEIEDIKQLISELQMAPKSKQKSIRAKLRRRNLYWQETAGNLPYTVESFNRLINNGIIKISDHNYVTNEGLLQKLRNKVTQVLNRNRVKQQEVSPVKSISASHKRKDSDEYYVISLCNEVLGETASQQHKFPFLLGDSGRPLPVDAYYEKLNLVIEYYECQHTEKVSFFDRKITVSGVTRGEQRKIYDERRKVELPENGIKLIIINYTDFGPTKKIKRDHLNDLNVVRKILKEHGII